MRSVSILIKPSSGMCNMSCDYCFYVDEIRHRKQESYGFMTLETLKNIIRRAMPNADEAISIAFQGGEPTLRGLDFFEELIKLEKKYNRKQIKIYNAIQTNGLAIDEKWCQFLHDNHFLAGLSIDGTQDIHDKYRHSGTGGDTFSRVCHTAELFDKYQVDYNILTVVSRDAALNVERIYDFYKSKNWRYQQYIPCIESLDGIKGVKEYSLNPREYGEFMVKLFHLWYEDFKKQSAPYIRQFHNYIGILMGYMPEACDQRGSCGIQHVAEADGSVYPCDFYMLDKYCIGNFNQNTFAQIQENRSKIGFVEESFKLSDACRQCRFYKLCRGGCQRNRSLNIHTGKYENYFCESYFYFFESCLKELKEIACLYNTKSI